MGELRRAKRFDVSRATDIARFRVLAQGCGFARILVLVLGYDGKVMVSR